MARAKSAPTRKPTGFPSSFSESSSSSSSIESFARGAGAQFIPAEGVATPRGAADSGVAVAAGAAARVVEAAVVALVEEAELSAEEAPVETGDMKTHEFIDRLDESKIVAE